MTNEQMQIFGKLNYKVEKLESALELILDIATGKKDSGLPLNDIRTICRQTLKEEKND